MKNKIAILIFAMGCTLELIGQATGNVIWNTNNRFYQNSSYRASSRGGKKEIQYSDANVYQQFANQGITQMSAVSGTEYFMNINILYNAKPTSYIAIFHINQAGKKINEMDSLLVKRVEKFIQLAKGLKIQREDFYLDMIALVPIFEKEKRIFSKSYIQVPKGFEMQKNLHVKYTDAGHLDKLFSMAAQCEIYDLIKVEYMFDSTQKAGEAMRNKAMEMMNKKVETWKKVGMRLDTCFKMITENGQIVFPIDKYASYTPLSISSIDNEDKPNEDGSFMKTNAGVMNRTTVFYNQTSCEGFDAVINPSPLQPPIQLMYSMQVRYRYTQPINTVVKTEKTTELLIVTPQGEIREIKK